MLTAFFNFYVWTQVSVSDWTQTSLISSLTHRRFLTDETFKLEPTDISCWSRWSRRKIQRIFCVIDFHHLSISVCTKCFSNSLNSGHILFFPLQQTLNITKDEVMSSPGRDVFWLLSLGFVNDLCKSFPLVTTPLTREQFVTFRWSEGQIKSPCWFCVSGVGQVEARRVFWFGRWTREKLQLLNSSWSCDDELLWQRISGEEV